MTTPDAPVLDLPGSSFDAPTDALIRDRIEAIRAFAADNDGIAPIVEAGDPVLRTECLPFAGQVDDAALADFAQIMRRTMEAAPGVGLAGPQVGVPLRMFVAQDPAGVDEETARVRERTPLAFRTVLNPVYEATTGERVSFYEGCLSIPGYQAVVARPRTIALRSETLAGDSVSEEITGWAARIVAHESDHLDGILYLDIAEMRSLASHDAVARWWNRPDVADAARALGFEVPDGGVVL